MLQQGLPRTLVQPTYCTWLCEWSFDQDLCTHNVTSVSKLFLHQSTTAASSVLAKERTFVPPFRPPAQSHPTTLTRSHSDACLSKPTVPSCPPNKGQEGRITSFFQPHSSAVLRTHNTQHTSPPIAFVVPVVSMKDTDTASRLGTQWTV